MKSKMIYIVVALVLVIGISAYYFLKPKFKLAESIPSPNNEYVLDVYKQTNFSHFGFSSQNAYKKTYVVLKDKQNTIIVEPGVFSSCTFTYAELKVFWEIENNKVYFTKFNYINLEDNSYSCQ